MLGRFFNSVDTLVTVTYGLVRCRSMQARSMQHRPMPCCLGRKRRPHAHPLTRAIARAPHRVRARACARLRAYHLQPKNDCVALNPVTAQRGGLPYVESLLPDRTFIFPSLRESILASQVTSTEPCPCSLLTPASSLHRPAPARHLSPSPSRPTTASAHAALTGSSSSDHTTHSSHATSCQRHAPRGIALACAPWSAHLSGRRRDALVPTVQQKRCLLFVWRVQWQLQSGLPEEIYLDYGQQYSFQVGAA